MGNILLADAHALTRVGMSAYINDLWRNSKISESDNFDDTIRLVKKGDFDLIVIDPDMPGGNGLQAVNHLRTIAPSLHILVLSWHIEDFYGLYYIKNGADGYIRVDAKGNDFRQALQLVHDGKKYFSDGMNKHLLADLSRKRKVTANPLQLLSAREIEILRYLMDGFSVKDISERLSLEMSTVSTYKKRVMGKMSAPNIMALSKVYDTLMKESVEQESS
jgi:two-component system invasion response regulator UvrY